MYKVKEDLEKSPLKKNDEESSESGRHIVPNQAKLKLLA